MLLQTASLLEPVMTWPAQHLLWTWFSLYQTDWRIHWEQGQRVSSPGHTSCHSHNFQLQKTRHLIMKATYGATSEQQIDLTVSKMEASLLYPEGQEVAFCFRHTMTWLL